MTDQPSQPNQPMPPPGPGQQPGYGAQPPGYGAPPAYGAQPGYGAPPAYGAQPPAYGAPPAYGTQPPAGPPPGYAPQFGPLGTPRNIGTCILLAIVTLGIYTYVWTWKTHEEMKQHTGNGVGGAVGFLIYFVISPVTWFLLPNEAKQMLERAGRPSRVKATMGFWFLLPIIGAFVWFIKVQGQLNEYWESLGAPRP